MNEKSIFQMTPEEYQEYEKNEKLKELEARKSTPSTLNRKLLKIQDRSFDKLEKTIGDNEELQTIKNLQQDLEQSKELNNLSLLNFYQNSKNRNKNSMQALLDFGNKQEQIAKENSALDQKIQKLDSLKNNISEKILSQNTTSLNTYNEDKRAPVADYSFTGKVADIGLSLAQSPAGLAGLTDIAINKAVAGLQKGIYHGILGNEKYKNFDINYARTKNMTGLTDAANALVRSASKARANLNSQSFHIDSDTIGDTFSNEGLLAGLGLTARVVRDQLPTTAEL